MLWSERLFIQDAIAARRDSVERTKLAIKRELNRGGGVGWNYEQTEQVCAKAVDQGIPLNQALSTATSINSETGRKSNKEAIGLLHPHFYSLQGRFYRLDNERFRIGPGISIRLRMLGHVFGDEGSKLYWIQYRKTQHLELEHKGLIGSVIDLTYRSIPEFRNAEISILDISAPKNGQRTLKKHDFGNLRAWNEKEVSEFFSPIHSAMIELIKERFVPERKKTKKKPDPNQPDLFE